MDETSFIPYKNYKSYSIEEMKKRSQVFLENIKERRTIRNFSEKPVPKEIIENCLRAASSAPSGANRQPWHFSVVSDSETKKKIREAAEKEEKKLYSGRAPDEWLEALEPLGTDENKPFLELAPYLIIIFSESYGLDVEGKKIKNYYVSESVGIATGLLITALHNAGLATLTHTPSPMNFLREILGRGENERAFLILVTGFPADDVEVPNIRKKSFEEYTSFF
ncbi:nitroreductase family protein [Euryarchaeota archaeon]|jgi:iodotyrosine deiodinase|nr:nitroreductase family protein [Euryarchaeota archaeon]